MVFVLSPATMLNRPSLPLPAALLFGLVPGVVGAEISNDAVGPPLCDITGTFVATQAPSGLTIAATPFTSTADGIGLTCPVTVTYCFHNWSGGTGSMVNVPSTLYIVILVWDEFPAASVAVMASRLAPRARGKSSNQKYPVR